MKFSFFSPPDRLNGIMREPTIDHRVDPTVRGDPGLDSETRNIITHALTDTIYTIRPDRYLLLFYSVVETRRLFIRNLYENRTRVSLYNMIDPSIKPYASIKQYYYRYCRRETRGLLTEMYRRRRGRAREQLGRRRDRTRGVNVADATPVPTRVPYGGNEHEEENFVSSRQRTVSRVKQNNKKNNVKTTRIKDPLVFVSAVLSRFGSR